MQYILWFAITQFNGHFPFKVMFIVRHWFLICNRMWWHKTEKIILTGQGVRHTELRHKHVRASYCKTYIFYGFHKCLMILFKGGGAMREQGGVHRYGGPILHLQGVLSWQKGHTMAGERAWQGGACMAEGHCVARNYTARGVCIWQEAGDDGLDARSGRYCILLESHCLWIYNFYP